MQDRYFIPTRPDGAKVAAELFKTKPLIDLEGKAAAGDEKTVARDGLPGATPDLAAPHPHGDLRGDLIDRGSYQVETVKLVRAMVEAGSARAVLAPSVGYYGLPGCPRFCDDVPLRFTREASPHL